VDSPSSVIAFQVLHKSTGLGKKCLAEKEMEIAQLLEKDEERKGEATFILFLFYLHQV
jgi:hypothetical protein